MTLNDWGLHAVQCDLTLTNGLGIYRGSTWSLKLGVYERNSQDKSETAVILDGMSGVMQIRKYCGSPQKWEVVAEPEVVVEGEEGMISAYLSDTETLQIPLEGSDLTWDYNTDYQYDLYLVDSDGKHHRVIHGLVEVSPEVYRNDIIEEDEEDAE